MKTMMRLPVWLMMLWLIKAEEEKKEMQMLLVESDPRADVSGEEENRDPEDDRVN